VCVKERVEIAARSGSMEDRPGPAFRKLHPEKQGTVHGQKGYQGRQSGILPLFTGASGSRPGAVAEIVTGILPSPFRCQALPGGLPLRSRILALSTLVLKFHRVRIARTGKENPAMFSVAPSAAATKPELYAELAGHARGLLAGEHDRIANAANFSALVFQSLPDLNWAGFYFYDGKELVVGPFQGKPACVRIALDRGVCGAAASQRRTQVVPDVHAFPGHIACDAASRSEIVVPLVQDGKLIGVWDVDSPVPGRFDEEDREGMEALCAIFLESLGHQAR
jgi:GAF domain-containing protein